MNKYLGFYELKTVGIPTIPWKEYSNDTSFQENILWTIRVAVENNNDLNLPRFVGVNSEEAILKCKELSNRYKNNGMVIYYPYFVAEKSGVLEVNLDYTVIEAVENDLWNLVTYGRKNITLKISKLKISINGDENFLLDSEIDELKKYSNIIKQKYRDEIFSGKSLLAEWSYAYKSNINNQPIGERYLVFYELRSV